ncbi:SAICAR synthase-like protein [Aulographum hederae CBS 113979]|uniref:SAICAR synthase-like protein n=1 Tax=Aulographum hederae CBS 113979 TaxID=1176131 RepID=A0A6G1H874_9PEZI|nr:SAICAR synthase-like protein [Aulographum hederae CBS 113979]
MGNRETYISKSILRSLFHEPPIAPKQTILARILTFFSFFQFALARFQAELFKELRLKIWQFEEDEYRESFRSDDTSGKLKPVGDLGYSGSTFFKTPNSKFLIKSIPRAFEHDFFAEDLLHLYADHMRAHPQSLLVRITDFLYSPHKTVGAMMGLAPTHHIIMENTLYGRDGDEAGPDAWETYDLKPASYFFPERDLAGGKLAPESVKERLIDDFPDKIRVTAHQRDNLLAHLVEDTRLLESANAVDYSLFLVRYPASHKKVGNLDALGTLWRDGVESTDSKWVYRAVLLDFFWAKHKLQPKLMTKMISSFNFFAKKGEMSITTSPGEYRGRFLRMVESLIEV